MSTDTADIVKADPVYRRRLFIAYGVVLAAGTAAATLALPWLVRTLAAMHPRKSFAIAEPLLIIALLLFAGPALYLIAVGRKVLHHGRIPYPGMKTIHDTKVLTGRSARVRGWALVGLGVFAIVMAITGAAMTHYFFERFRRDPMFRGIFQDSRETPRDGTVSGTARASTRVSDESASGICRLRGTAVAGHCFQLLVSAARQYRSVAFSSVTPPAGIVTAPHWACSKHRAFPLLTTGTTL